LGICYIWVAIGKTRRSKAWCGIPTIVLSVFGLLDFPVQCAAFISWTVSFSKKTKDILPNEYGCTIEAKRLT